MVSNRIDECLHIHERPIDQWPHFMIEYVGPMAFISSMMALISRHTMKRICRNFTFTFVIIFYLSPIYHHMCYNKEHKCRNPQSINQLFSFRYRPNECKVNQTAYIILWHIYSKGQFMYTCCGCFRFLLLYFHEINRLGHHWLRWWFGANQSTGHYINQCRPLVN